MASLPPAGEPVIIEDPSTEVSLDTPWNVIVWDDPINLMSYVVWVFQKVFGFSIEEATRRMLEVHNEGRSLVKSCDRERAEHYVARLHVYGLQATMEKSTDGSEKS